jgi:hypothetical protein
MQAQGPTFLPPSLFPPLPMHVPAPICFRLCQASEELDPSSYLSTLATHGNERGRVGGSRLAG